MDHLVATGFNPWSFVKDVIRASTGDDGGNRFSWRGGDAQWEEDVPVMFRAYGTRLLSASLSLD